MSDDAVRAGHELERSTVVDVVARTGLVAYGVVHLVLAWLALQLAVGHTGHTANTTGAMHELASQPLGQPLLWAVAIGMFLLVVWQLVEAGFGHRTSRNGARTARRLLSLGKAVVYGALGVSALRVVAGSGSSGSKPQGLTGKVLGWTGGPAIVAVVGLAVLGLGIALVVIGWQERFLKNLDRDGRTGAAGTTYRWLGRIGHIAKGFAIGAVGVLVAYAGITHDPKHSGGLDRALQDLLQQPLGPALTGAIGVGFGCFGLFCFARSRHLDR